MYYDKRNKENIAKLAPNTQKATLELYDFAVREGIEILIYDTIRTEAQQRLNVANGVSQTMKSYHLVGQALDFVMTHNATTNWSDYDSPNAKKLIAKARALGFEWGGDWSGFVDKCHLQYNYKGYGTDKIAEGNSTTQSNNSSNNVGSSLVDYLKSINIDSSLTNRKKLATINGIGNYAGTAEQNTKLLNALRSNTAIKKSGYQGNSIVDYLKSINVDNSFNNRKKLATSKGISNYSGTEQQNLQLLKTIRGF